MRRLVWIGAALLIMVGIFGYAMFTMRHIEQVNQERRERDKGNDIAIQIAATTATTSIWDRLRETETTIVGTDETGETQPTEDSNAMHEAQGHNPTEETAEESPDTETNIETTLTEPETPAEREPAFTIIVNS